MFHIRVSQNLNAGFLLLASALVLMADDVSNLAVQGGKVKFDASTNISAVSVHGESSQMTASFQVRNSGNQMEVIGVQAKLDPKSLSTGMSLRDDHMRNKVFASGNGVYPDLEFVATKVACPGAAQGQEIMCPVSGEISLRGTKKPFVMNLKIRNEGNSYRATGGGTLKLTAFGVEPPCQLGVCVKDDVKLQIEFQAKQSPELRSSREVR
jgi:polyisoprenoid-binding protein YceI